jgi:hypothetical protein
MHSVVHVNLHCRVASSHLHRPRANVERDVHFKKELDFLIYMRRLAAGVKPCISSQVGFLYVQDFGSTTNPLSNHF